MFFRTTHTTRLDDVLHHLFKGEPVFFVHSQQERWEHDHQHGKHGPGVADGATGQKIGRDAHRRRRAETDKLAFGEVKGHFCFDLR